MKRNMNKNQNGFTLVELLTVMAVVGILLGLLIPALSQVQKGARKVKQKAQFHAIGIGLEAFQSDMGYYPQSQTVVDVSGPDFYTGPQILAEAIVGRDGFGFHPSSTFQPDGKDGTTSIYVPDVMASPSNLSARKGPYLELESANAVTLENIYPTVPTNLENASATLSNYVLVDMYKQVKHLGTGKQIGMPILYYRANTSSGTWPVNLASISYLEALNSPYNAYDGIAAGLYKTPSGIGGVDAPFGGVHPLATNAGWFYTKIQNPNFNNPPRPYRSESFILQSAGEDGLYGTEDDIFNFDQDN